MRDERKLVHINAVSVAEGMGRRAAPLVPVLLEIATDPPGGSHVDIRAINAVMAIDPGNARLMDIALEGLLDKERRNWRPLFEKALRRGGDIGARTMANALATADSSGKLLLLSLLPRNERVKCQVIEQVRDLFDDPDPRVSCAAREFVSPMNPLKSGRRD